jgi:hypothetical protein
MPPNLADGLEMQRQDLEALWTAMPWGALWAFALITAAAGIVACLVEGWTFGAAIVFGLLIGPGWLAVATLAGLIRWACAGRTDHHL